MTKFEINNIYTARCSMDHNSRINYRVIARTAKTVTIIDLLEGKTSRRSIQIGADGSEFIYPEGRYSMAPVLNSSNRAMVA